LLVQREQLLTRKRSHRSALGFQCRLLRVFDGLNRFFNHEFQKFAVETLAGPSGKLAQIIQIVPVDARGAVASVGRLQGKCIGEQR
jgi:hypothetical protein